MATKLFNYTNQKLNAEKFRVINGFNSFNFAGILAEKSPFDLTDISQVRLMASESYPVTFIGGGVLLTQETELLINMMRSNTLAVLEVQLDPNASSIITDDYNKVTLKYLELDYIKYHKPYTIYSVVEQAVDNPKTKGYYEYNAKTGTYAQSTSTILDPEVTYYAKYESATVSFRTPLYGSTVYQYNGNTIWLNSDTFIIPLLANMDGEVKEVCSVKNLKDLSLFLSLEAYNALRAYCEGTFVWSVGGEEPVTAPDGTTHRKGDVGGLNISNTTIRNNNNTGTDDAPTYYDPVNFINISIEALKGEDTTNHRLYVDENGQLCKEEDYKVPVSAGGTYDPTLWDKDQTVWKNAKDSLHIRYGYKEPSSVYPFSPPSEGDIYLKIIS